MVWSYQAESKLQEPMDGLQIGRVTWASIVRGGLQSRASTRKDEGEAKQENMEACEKSEHEGENEPEEVEREM